MNITMREDIAQQLSVECLGIDTQNERLEAEPPCIYVVV